MHLSRLHVARLRQTCLLNNAPGFVLWLARSGLRINRWLSTLAYIAMRWTLLPFSLVTESAAQAAGGPSAPGGAVSVQERGSVCLELTAAADTDQSPPQSKRQPLRLSRPHSRCNFPRSLAASDDVCLSAPNSDLMRRQA